MSFPTHSTLDMVSSASKVKRCGQPTTGGLVLQTRSQTTKSMEVATKWCPRLCRTVHPLRAMLTNMNIQRQRVNSHQRVASWYSKPQCTRNAPLSAVERRLRFGTWPAKCVGGEKPVSTSAAATRLTVGTGSAVRTGRSVVAADKSCSSKWDGDRQCDAPHPDEVCTVEQRETCAPCHRGALRRHRTEVVARLLPFIAMGRSFLPTCLAVTLQIKAQQPTPLSALRCCRLCLCR